MLSVLIFLISFIAASPPSVRADCYLGGHVGGQLIIGGNPATGAGAPTYASSGNAITMLEGAYEIGGYMGGFTDQPAVCTGCSHQVFSDDKSVAATYTTFGFSSPDDISGCSVSYNGVEYNTAANPDVCKVTTGTIYGPFAAGGHSACGCTFDCTHNYRRKLEETTAEVGKRQDQMPVFRRWNCLGCRDDCTTTDIPYFVDREQGTCLTFTTPNTSFKYVGGYDTVANVQKGQTSCNNLGEFINSDTCYDSPVSIKYAGRQIIPPRKRKVDVDCTDTKYLVDQSVTLIGESGKEQTIPIGRGPQCVNIGETISQWKTSGPLCTSVDYFSNFDECTPGQDNCEKVWKTDGPSDGDGQLCPGSSITNILIYGNNRV